MPAALLTPNFVLRTNRAGRFEIRWTEPKTGKTRMKSTGTEDRATAEAALQRHVSDWHAPKLSTAPAIADLIGGYKQAQGVKYRSTQDLSLTKIAEHLGTRRPTELTDDMLAEYARWRAKQSRWGRTESGTIGDGTIAREINALRAVLSWGYRNQHLPRPIAIRLPVSAPPPRERHLTHDELIRLLDTAKQTPHLELFIRVAVATGARMSATLGLTWDRVKWPEDPEPLYHRLAAGGEYEYQALRHGMALDMGRGRGNKRRAIVPLGDNAPLYKALRAAQKVAKTDHVIEWRGKPVADIKTAFDKARVRAGLGKDVTIHTLKHTSISWQVARGVPVAIISQITGTSPQTIMKVYGHLSPAVASELGDLFAV